MYESKVKAMVVAVLTTALETEPDVFPESFGYLAVGSDMGSWRFVRELLRRAGLCEFAGSAIRLTENGRAAAREMQAALVSA